MANYTYPEHLAGESTLPDGTRITIRPIRPADAELEREFVDGLSDHSRYLRFMYGMRRISPELVSRFTRIDYDREMALIAVVPVDGRDREIGVARFVTDAGHGSCEFAIVVADDWQNRGVATELLRRLIGIAHERGLERMEGVTLRENRGMLALAEELGFERRVSPDDTHLVELSLRLAENLSPPS